jgi:hypothetical protein
MTELSTIITLTLPHSDRLDGKGTLLIQRGALAHLMPFTYIDAQDITAAIQSAYIALTALENNPPVISEILPATPPKPSITRPVTSAEPMLDIPVGKKTQRIPARLLQVAQPDQQEQAIQIASKLLVSKLWDGQSVIRIADAAKTLKKLQPLDVKTLSLFTLTDFVEIGEFEPSEQTIEETDEFSNQLYNEETPSKFSVGQRVHLTAGATDIDGDSIGFNVGRIVEIDESEQPVRVWVESTDGENDVWISAQYLQPLTADL